MEPRVSLITIGTRDFARAVRFYRDGLGWPMSSASQGDTAFFKTGGAVLTVWSREKLAADAQIPDDGGSGFGGITLSHNVPTREAVDTVLAEALAAGATLLVPARTAEWGGYIAHFADPDGYVWEVAWNPYFPLAEDGSIQLP